jgi:hypothetical protein
LPWFGAIHKGFVMLVTFPLSGYEFLLVVARNWPVRVHDRGFGEAERIIESKEAVGGQIK